MKFQLVTALLAGAAVAAPMNLYVNEDQVEKRQLDPLSVAIIAGLISSVVGASATQGFNIAKDASDWTEAREAFTQATVDEMAKSMKPGEAAVCYNMGYKVSKPNQMRELTSVRLKSGVLNTDYDCFYMSGPDNHFNSEGDGGYINLAIRNNEDSCTYDAKTSDLYCK